MIRVFNGKKFQGALVQEETIFQYAVLENLTRAIETGFDNLTYRAKERSRLNQNNEQSESTGDAPAVNPEGTEPK